MVTKMAMRDNNSLLPTLPSIAPPVVRGSTTPVGRTSLGTALSARSRTALGRVRLDLAVTLTCWALLLADLGIGYGLATLDLESGFFQLIASWNGNAAWPLGFTILGGIALAGSAFLTRGMTSADQRGMLGLGAGVALSVIGVASSVIAIVALVVLMVVALALGIALMVALLAIALD